jgi:hypothetical protein
MTLKAILVAWRGSGTIKILFGRGHELIALSKSLLNEPELS